jgi:flagellar biosynthesis regulator FlbT
MAKTSQTKAFIRKGEVFFLNGALIRAHDSFSMEIMLADTFLLPSQIVSEETAKSHLQKAYYYAQQMMIEPSRKADWQNRLESSVVKLPSSSQKKIWRACQEDNLQKILTVIRSELKKDVASIN